jgi:hypothetical protein
MLAVRTMKRSVKIFLAWRHKDDKDSRDDSDAGRQDNEEVSETCLAWRHKDEQDSVDDSDAGLQDNEEVS